LMYVITFPTKSIFFTLPPGSGSHLRVRGQVSLG
jgi:hypothetical protein